MGIGLVETTFAAAFCGNLLIAIMAWRGSWLPSLLPGAATRARLYAMQYAKLWGAIWVGILIAWSDHVTVTTVALANLVIGTLFLLVGMMIIPSKKQ